MSTPTKKMIVIEGCDGSGKSTLARALARSLEIPVAERVVTSEDGPPSKSDLIKWTYRELADPMPKIYDRFPIYSDPIYARLLKREHYIGTGMIRHFHEAETPFLILCDPGFEAVREGALKEKQLRGVLPNLEAIHAQYRKLPFIDYVYDHTDDSETLGYNFMLELINDYLEN